jgi:predicted transcriptional regulator
MPRPEDEDTMVGDDDDGSLACRAVAKGGASDASRRRGAGELEGDVLAVLWAADGPLTTPEIHDALGTDLAYTTVATILTRLVDKGLAHREKTGRAHSYAAVDDPAVVAEAGFRSVLTRTHDRRALLQGFVDSLSSDEETMLRELLAEARTRRRTGG